MKGAPAPCSCSRAHALVGDHAAHGHVLAQVSDHACEGLGVPLLGWRAVLGGAGQRLQLDGVALAVAFPDRCELAFLACQRAPRTRTTASGSAS